MAASPQTVVLSGNAGQATFDLDYTRIEVTNLTGEAEVSISTDGSTPTNRGTGYTVLPAAVGAWVIIDCKLTDPSVVKFISPGNPTVTVRILK